MGKHEQRVYLEAIRNRKAKHTDKCKVLSHSLILAIGPCLLQGED